MQLIEKIFEPSRLYLNWQNPRKVADQPAAVGTRYRVAEIVREGDDYRFTYLVNSQSFNQAVALGFDGYRAFDIAKVTYQNPNLLDSFSRRIFKKTRNDYNEFLNYFGIASGVEVSDFAMLGYSGGVISGDRFSFEVDISDAELPLEFPTSVVGARHSINSENPFAQEIYINRKIAKTEDFYRSLGVEVIAEPQNDNDPNAHQVKLTRPYQENLGYINRVIAEQLINLKPQTIGAEILRINGTIESPQILLKLRIEKAPISL